MTILHGGVRGMCWWSKLRLHYYTRNKFFTAKSNFTEAETTISFSLNARPIFS